MVSHREARFRAIAQLQRLRMHLHFGSFEFRAADYAIDLVLSPTRAVSKHLARNAYRNARFILARRKQGDIYETLLDIDKEVLFEQTSYTAPDAAIEYAELQSTIVARVGDVHRDGAYVLKAMMEEEPVAETAQALGYSKRTIKTIRSVIRNEVQVILQEVAV